MPSEQISAGLNLETATPLEIIQNRIETERLETILLSRVLTEHALIDDNHADELGASMKQKRGQITPIAVRARLDDLGEVVYDVIDGFHRTEGKKRSGDKIINATVIYGCSDEEMYDLRILAASSVRSVQFARIAQWISNSFDTTSWAERGLSVSQAFNIVVSNASRSYLVRLEEEEMRQLKDWVITKCKRWGKTPSSIYQLLRVVANADPELVKEVRTAAGGHEREGVITQAKLKLVVDVFPGKENHPLQRAILHHGIREKLKIDQIGGIVQQLKGKITAGMDDNEIESAIRSAKTQHLVFPPQPKKEPEGENGSETWYESEDWDDLEPSDAELDEIEKDVKIPPLGNDYYLHPRKGKAPKTTGVNGGILNAGAYARGEKDDVVSLRERIKDLEEALEAANSKRRKGMETWWRTAQYLTVAERTSMERGFYANEDLEDLAKEFRGTVPQVILLMRSAFAKRRLLEPERVFASSL